jgi:L,D-transpeptidase YcbB
MPPQNKANGADQFLGVHSVKSVRFERLLASTLFGLILALSGHAGLAQQAVQTIEAVAPVPETDASPPPTGKAVQAPSQAQPADIAKDAPKADPKNEPKQDAATPAAEPKSEPKQDTAAPAAEPAKAVAAPAPAGVDTQVADQLRELITGKRLDRFVARRDDRAGVDRFYKARDYKPLWTSDGKAGAREKAAAGYLGQVETVGLDPRDYAVPDFAAALTPGELAAAELKFTNSVLTYARNAQIGRIHFSRVASDISFKLEAPDPAEVLDKLAGGDDVAAALDSYNPPQEGFKALKKALAELRTNGGQIAKPKEEPNPGANVHVPEGAILRLGMKDKRVPALRKRLNIGGDKDNTLYDEAVVEAVKTFQTEADLDIDGNAGPNTVRALNGEKRVAHRPAANPIDTILVNMERWRWLPRKLGNDQGNYVVVNVPDYTLTLYRGGEPYWKTKIVVGQPSKMTPMTSAEMKFITVNPTWNVPPSIIENEYLPALQQDPNALDRIGLKIYQDPDGTVHVYQPPGAANALGRIRFNFPNKFLVYQHDTPDKYLFKRDKRAFSHGCMRVENPLEYGTKLMSIEAPQEHYTPAKFESMFGGNEININFRKPIPVHLTYQTAFVDQDGKLQLRADVYGRDATMIEILKNPSERKVADIAVERAPDLSSKPVRLPSGTYGSFGNEGYAYRGGPGFFDFLFGGGQAAPQPVYRPRGTIDRRTDNGRRWTR